MALNQPVATYKEGRNGWISGKNVSLCRERSACSQEVECRPKARYQGPICTKQYDSVELVHLRNKVNI